MGIRIYPIMTEGVSEGEAFGFTKRDSAQLIELKARMTTDELFDFLYTDGNERLRELNSCILSGWGKFNAIDEQKDEDGYTLDCGDMYDKNSLLEFCNKNGEVGDKIVQLIANGVIVGLQWG